MVHVLREGKKKEKKKKGIHGLIHWFHITESHQSKIFFTTEFISFPCAKSKANSFTKMVE